jgi:hypothetical protein
MKRKQAIDLSDVKIHLLSESESDLEAEVTTKHGAARLTMDFSSGEYVGLRAMLPSGNVYTSKIDSGASEVVDDETDAGCTPVLRLSAAFVVQCFEKELQKQN